MLELLVLYSENLSGYKQEFLALLVEALKDREYIVHETTSPEEVFDLLSENSRVVGLIFDWDYFDMKLPKQLAELHYDLPVFALTNRHSVLDINLNELRFNLDFLQYDSGLIEDDVSRIFAAVDNYVDAHLPPFTKALMQFVADHKYTFCTPGHLGGTAFQRALSGSLFYDFFGPHIFKADISISVSELGSLLDHSGPHRDAEEFAAEVFGSDRTLFVLNGTSTSNKIVGMYAATEGETILVNRNCHKSITHYMMMNNVTPVYLKPTRNAHGILGGIPKAEFSKAVLNAKLKAADLPSKWASYAVVTNSTYDGLFYNADAIAKTLEVQHLHFDGAWVPYAHFHPIYKHKYGMGTSPRKGQTVFETQSTHKLLAAFSQASMVHMKGEYDEEVLNECYMMHTSTSPFYSMVAACEVSAAMMQGKSGLNLMNKILHEAWSFRKEIVRLQKASKGWYYNVWQPQDIKALDCWELQPGEKWHGFKEIDKNHLFLDPLKITLLTPGLENGQFKDFGIPAAIVAMYLDRHGIVVEKTGPYTMLFLFSIGINKAKAMKLLSVLNRFKENFDANLSVKKMLPELYAEHPEFYEGMHIQDLAQGLHDLMRKHDLPNIMYQAFDVLPKMQLTPHQAYQEHVRGHTEYVHLKDLPGRVSAVMVLPYPPGIPLLMPGEMLTAESKAILDYLLLLEDLGLKFPGFEADVHGLQVDQNGYFKVKVLK